MILSVLDRSPIPEGSTAAAALHDTLDLADLADRGADVPHPGWQAGRSAPSRGCSARRRRAPSGADEAIVLTITHDHGARRRSYELIAEAFGLEPAAPSSSVATAR